MLFPHIIDLHLCQRTIGKCFLDSQSRIVCMHMNFYNVFIRNHDDGITYGFQICLEFFLRLCSIFFLKHNNKFCTITKADICFRLASRCLCRGCNRLLHGKIHFFSKKYIKCAFQYLHKTLTAGIYNPSLL